MLYNLAAQWLTLAAVFFFYNYFFVMLQVVTLGGMVAGALLLGALMTALGRTARLLGRLDNGSGGLRTFLMQVEYIIVFIFAFIAACCLCFILPGYEPNRETSKPVMLLFFLGYTYLTVWSTKRLG